MKITISQEEINKISLNQLGLDYPYQNTNHPGDPLGQPFHNLYAYFSTLFNGIRIADIGTRTGNSALALSYNENNIVDSYDVNSNYYNIVTEHIKKSNINFNLENILASPKILQYPLISLDVDPHDGIQERYCFAFLEANNYKGIVLLDDIGPDWPALDYWFRSINLPKWNLTKYGHFSGTGLVDFTGELEVELQ
jgi:hypothetical protein